MKEKRALVLQGGALRCAYTAGVLDVFLEEGIEFDYVIGVSAGSLCTFAYVTKQKGRSYRLLKDSLSNHKLASILNLVKYRSFFNFQYMFFEYLKDEWPFDFESFEKTDVEICYVATNLRTGNAHYFYNYKNDDMFLASKASSSIAIVSQKVKIGDDYYLDGGYSDGIPFKKAIEDGATKVCVVSTRDRTYRADVNKKQNSKMTKFTCLHFAKYPNFAQRVYDYPVQYNKNLDELYEYEKEHKLFLIAPSSPVPPINNVLASDKDEKNLDFTYEMGKKDAKNKLEEIKKYLKEEI